MEQIHKFILISWFLFHLQINRNYKLIKSGSEVISSSKSCMKNKIKDRISNLLSTLIYSSQQQLIIATLHFHVSTIAYSINTIFQQYTTLHNINHHNIPTWIEIISAGYIIKVNPLCLLAISWFTKSNFMSGTQAIKQYSSLTKWLVFICDRTDTLVTKMFLKKYKIGCKLINFRIIFNCFLKLISGGATISNPMLLFIFLILTSLHSYEVGCDVKYFKLKASSHHQIFYNNFLSRFYWIFSTNVILNFFTLKVILNLLIVTCAIILNYFYYYYFYCYSIYSHCFTFMITVYIFITYTNTHKHSQLVSVFLYLIPVLSFLQHNYGSTR